MLVLEVAFSLNSNIIQSAYSTLEWALNSQSDFDLVLYKHNWEFPIHKKIIQKYVEIASLSRWETLTKSKSNGQKY